MMNMTHLHYEHIYSCIFNTDKHDHAIQLMREYNSISDNNVYFNNILPNINVTNIQMLVECVVEDTREALWSVPMGLKITKFYFWEA